MHKTKAAIAGILALFAVASASAQQFPIVPDRTVIGRIGVGGSSGPSQAIPFATLFSQFGSVTLPVISDNAAVFDGTSGKIKDSLTTIRTRLTAPITFYVNPSSTTAALCNGSTGGVGNASNPGTLAAPFLTPAAALATALSRYDVNQSLIIIQYCDNNVTGAVYPVFSMQSNLVGAISGGNASVAQLIIKGNSGTPANVIVQGAAGAGAFSFVGVTSPVLVADMQIGSTLIGGATTGHGIVSDAHSMVYYSNITWGFILTSHSHIVATYGSFIEQEGVERIIGGAALHWYADRASQILTTGFTVTCTGSPAFASSFIGMQNESVFNLSGAAFSGCGSVTGTRYIADYTSSFGVGTADPNTIYPGNANGAVTLPSFGMTGILVGNGGPLTGANQTTAMPAMNGDVTLTLATGVSAIGTNRVTRAMEAQGIARSVIGVTGNATANVADIQGTADQALVVNSAGTALAFGKVNLTAGAGATGTLPVANGGTGDTGTAWTAFTPTQACGNATVTSTSARSKTLGKTTWIQADFTITAIGTTCGAAPTNLTFNLPNTAQSAANLHGREGANSNKGINCLILAAGTQGLCLKDDTTNWVVNDHIQFSGVYENQ